jgi:hypothetical protein
MLLANPSNRYTGREASGRIRRNLSTSEESLSDEEELDVAQTARSWPYT